MKVQRRSAVPRSYQNSALIVLVAVWATSCYADTTHSMDVQVSKPNLHAAHGISAYSSSGWRGGHDKESTRLLRGSGPQEPQEEDVATPEDGEARMLSTVFSTLAAKIVDGAKWKWWRFRNLSPDQVLMLLRPKSTSDPAYKLYIKYFYTYHVENVDASISRFAAPVIKQIWKARVNTWIQTLSPPQVLKKLRITNRAVSAKDQEKLAYFEDYYVKWKQTQRRQSAPPLAITL